MVLDYAYTCTLQSFRVSRVEVPAAVCTGAGLDVSEGLLPFLFLNSAILINQCNMDAV
jgi:hypothetical protein